MSNGDASPDARAIADGLHAIATWLGTGSAGTTMGGMEAHAVLVGEKIETGATRIAEAIQDLADAVREHGAVDGP